MNFFKRPPLRFDIVVVIGHVGVFHVDPVTYALAHLLPFVLILENGFLALIVKRLNPVSFDLFFAVETELFFHFEFHGKSVRIPARFSQNVPALHRLKARDNVLHDAR